MFGFGSGKAAYPSIYTAAAKKASRKDDPLSAPIIETGSSSESLEPSIDGPPSPERIRAYTEQMKRSSIFGNNSRTNTLSSSSASSSFRSRDSTYTSTDALSLSRRSSGRSTASIMPSINIERSRPESALGSIFHRGGRRLRKENESNSPSSSTASLGKSIPEEGLVKHRYYRMPDGISHIKDRSSSRKSTNFPRRQPISEPYNFQHITHTRQDHLPDLERSSRQELVSGFSAIRKSQAPTKGGLKEIMAEDLHFENFSSEALNVPPNPTEEDHTTLSPSAQSPNVPRKSVRPPLMRRPMSYAKSHDNLRSAPPRPPRSPLLLPTSIELPTKKSSRTASVLFDTFDPLAITSGEPVQMNGIVGTPVQFDLPTPPQDCLTWGTQQQDISIVQSDSHALTTPGDVAWPLTVSPNGHFDFELNDVQEEDETGLRKSRTSTELRASQSVPVLRVRPSELNEETPGFQFGDDSWEQDIDYCYEHEIEANCDYQWDRVSVSEATVVEDHTTTTQSSLALHLEDDNRSVYHGRFRPSLLIPSTYDVPELSPLSNASAISSNPRTPQANFISLPLTRASPSQPASPFKESHGFTLSPSLLIPFDFQTQIDEDAGYEDRFSKITSSAGSIIESDSYNGYISPIDETSSSVFSYRSSNFSRGSARSSSSTRMSARGSQDSVILMGRSSGLSQTHRSIGSQSSLPDLIPSSNIRSEVVHENAVLNVDLSILDINDEVIQADPLPLASMQHRRQKSSFGDMGIRKGINHFAPSFLPVTSPEGFETSSVLSPVPESFPELLEEEPSRGQVHGRKFSAPVVSQTVKEFKSRPRAGTVASSINSNLVKKPKGGYMLFPQVPPAQEKIA